MAHITGNEKPKKNTRCVFGACGVFWQHRNILSERNSFVCNAFISGVIEDVMKVMLKKVSVGQRA
jgi:hypothetical protein